MKIIRLNERDIARCVRMVVEQVMNEDGAMGGDAATPGATSDSADRMGAYDVPFGGVQRRGIYTPRKKDPTLRRKDGKGGSISIPKD